ncbi:MAG: hypothetical protein HQ474_10515 [Flammeovirgaceae bacterium]|nr:hypothetical protein [Flammeovirgaceae bacterium]|tara:strand:+ start:7100 stop:7582 length:483 start_codon:yes stop_codon:yes gene_type:complete
MTTTSLIEIKNELKELNNQDLIKLILRLAKHKVENKELLGYLLFESTDQEAYVQKIFGELNDQFHNINNNSYYLIKKSIRKIQRLTKKNIKYSQKKEIEVTIGIYFCKKILQIKPSIRTNNAIMNILERQVLSIRKSLISLNEDLQFDFQSALDRILKES